MKRHPITQSDAQQQAAALVECEQFLRYCGIRPIRCEVRHWRNQQRCDHCGAHICNGVKSWNRRALSNTYCSRGCFYRGETANQQRKQSMPGY